MGDTNYQQLSKDLAQLQMSVIAAKGGSLDTVAGQGLARAANGDVTYAPNVIRDIARRTYGDVLATEAEGAAADLFRQRYGDANHAAFKQLWSKNSDSRVFELMGLEDLVQDPKEQEKVAREVILKGLSAKQIDELTKKYKNIKRLRETGSL
jgi:SOS response regulatory protein OraA/RecX